MWVPNKCQGLEHLPLSCSHDYPEMGPAFSWNHSHRNHMALGKGAGRPLHRSHLPQVTATQAQRLGEQLGVWGGILYKVQVVG